MIIRLTGGLGNQMFQYAYGRASSLGKHIGFKYFFIHYKGDTKRNYELNVFNIKGTKINAFFFGKLSKIGDIYKIKIPNVESGYWQSERYFKKYENVIREDFTIKEKPSGDNLKLLKKIESVDSISLHIRRGDYVNDKAIKEYHGIPDISYYKKAVEVIKRRVKKPVFFVFSDDIDWCIENFSNMNNIIFVGGNNNLKDYEDMRLMSNCKHNIIANSSFSWWGAWLNKNPNKIVIAPKKWFANKNAQNEFGKGVVPKEWIKI